MIPEQYQILTLDGFFERFRQLQGQQKTLKMIEVYNLVEDEYYALVGRNRFTSYDSFRNTRKYYDDKKPKNKKK